MVKSSYRLEEIPRAHRSRSTKAEGSCLSSAGIERKPTYTSTRSRVSQTTWWGAREVHFRNRMGHMQQKEWPKGKQLGTKT